MADARDLLAARAVPVAVIPHSTSYFSAPHDVLDPEIFSGERMRGAFRREQQSDVLRFLEMRFRNPETWSTLWLAGSSASYQWAGTDPGDLDLLIGIDYAAFRRANPGYSGISDAEISAYLNRQFQAFNGRVGRYDRTLYSNPHATDIRAINPYAAYDITHDEWTVHPDAGLRAPDDPELRAAGDQFTMRASGAVHAYNAAKSAYDLASTDHERLNHAVRLRHAADVASSLFDEVHHGRRVAFGPEGTGYTDPHQYAWQAGKASGAIEALRAIKSERDAVYDNPDAEADRVLIEAALYRRTR